ncbi:methyl-accepting chemotaxis protein [Paraburkholderia nemoris]|uniref:methyl-accepting chemotaxis protein n=1 Tax=Paraburkholderia nemoris TaxID=2793076 RepID=UPI0038BDF4FA
MIITSNRRIGTRLAFGFGFTLLLVCIVGGVGLFVASRIFGGAREINENWLPSVEVLGKMQGIANDVRRTALRSVLSLDAGDKSQQTTLHNNDLSKFEAALTEYSRLVSSPEEQKLYNAIKSTWAQYVVSDRQLMELAAGGQATFADARMLSTGRSANQFTSTLDVIDEDIKLNALGAQHEVDAAAATYRMAMFVTSSLVLVALAAGAAIAVFIARSITFPIRRSVEVAETVAAGNLTTLIEVRGRDETSQLLRALKHMNSRLFDIVGKVLASSKGVAATASEIAAGNVDLSQRTEEQAASLEQTAASMEQLTASVKQNSENARQGNLLAANASETAARGGVVVGRVVETMQEIARSSGQVAEIISVIEGIAFQTNILALNAAVEAARAGEQGRGFAVVAAEVRSLAQRSATAAKEIKDLIDTSVDRVRAGTVLVDDAGQTMQQVVQAVDRVSDLMGEISAASDEQYVGIEQVNRAVTQMDEVTQQNAALVEEAAAAAQSMAAQATALREFVAVFELGSLVHAASAETLKSR